MSRSIHVIYGEDARDMALKLLEAADAGAGLNPTDPILIKPNLVVARPASDGATTTPGFARGAIEYFRGRGFTNISITEGSWLGCNTQTAFRTCGYAQLAQEMKVPLIDTKQDSSTSLSAGGMNIRVCDVALNAKLIVSLPVLKGHCQTGMTCALKNMKGLIPDSEKRHFHSMGLHKPIAAVNTLLPRQFILVDALNGDLDFEEGGNPVTMNMAFATDDPVLCDAYAARLLGFELSEVPYIGLAEKLGVGSTDLSSAEITELNHAVQARKPARSGKAARLSAYIQEDMACSACYGSAIRALARLDETGGLRRLNGKLHLGQGYRGKTFEGIGIGQCAKGASCHLGGCPASASEIIEFLSKAR